MTGRSFFGKQGDVFTGTIPVTNTSDEPVSARIYAGDWVRLPDNYTGYAFDIEGGHEVRSFVEWMTFSPERMTLEPHETRDISFEITLPEDVPLDGSYWAVIFVENIPEEEYQIPEVPDPEAVEVGIKTIFRYAIQIFATIEDTEIRDASFSYINIEQQEIGINVVAVLNNKGNTHIRPFVWLEIRDVAGEVVYEERAAQITVLPESFRQYLFELRSLNIESGDYLIMVLADYGATGLVAAQGQISIVVDPAPDGESSGGESE